MPTPQEFEALVRNFVLTTQAVATFKADGLEPAEGKDGVLELTLPLTKTLPGNELPTTENEADVILFLNKHDDLKEAYLHLPSNSAKAAYRHELLLLSNNARAGHALEAAGGQKAGQLVVTRLSDVYGGDRKGDPQLDVDALVKEAVTANGPIQQTVATDSAKAQTTSAEQGAAANSYAAVIAQGQKFATADNQVYLDYNAGLNPKASGVTEILDQYFFFGKDDKPAAARDKLPASIDKDFSFLPPDQQQAIAKFIKENPTLEAPLRAYAAHSLDARHEKDTFRDMLMVPELGKFRMNEEQANKVVDGVSGGVDALYPEDKDYKPSGVAFNAEQIVNTAFTANAPDLLQAAKVAPAADDKGQKPAQKTTGHAPTTEETARGQSTQAMILTVTTGVKDKLDDPAIAAGIRKVLYPNDAAKQAATGPITPEEYDLFIQRSQQATYDPKAYASMQALATQLKAPAGSVTEQKTEADKGAGDGKGATDKGATDTSKDAAIDMRTNDVIYAAPRTAGGLFKTGNAHLDKVAALSIEFQKPNLPAERITEIRKEIFVEARAYVVAGGTPKDAVQKWNHNEVPRYLQMTDGENPNAEPADKTKAAAPVLKAQDGLLTGKRSGGGYFDGTGKTEADRATIAAFDGADGSKKNNQLIAAEIGAAFPKGKFDWKDMDTDGNMVIDADEIRALPGRLAEIAKTDKGKPRQ